ncbi:MAG: S41 family peptidase [Syntrophomonadaceae bacterium]|nr:S41 family peptidase [Syntrophomonadaceae bacterium]
MRNGDGSVKGRLIAGLMVMFLLLGSTPLSAGQVTDDREYLKAILQFIDDNYYQDIEIEKLDTKTVQTIFSGLDPYTRFYTHDEAAEFMDYVSGDYQGIGVILLERDKKVIVKQVMEQSPAALGGILPGDRIMKVDDVDVTYATIEKVAELVRGETGTEVIVELLRGDQRLIYKIERSEIIMNPVYSDIREEIAYIYIESFNANTQEFLEKELNKAAEKNINYIILDLRENSGGSVQQAVAAARYFVPRGLITRLDFGAEDLADIYYGSYLDTSPYNLVVLVDEGTASAAEILAGAVQDSGAGVLIGSQTFGKARVQDFMALLSPQAFYKYRERYAINSVDPRKLPQHEWEVLSDEDLLGWVKMTTGIYYTPKGRNIDGQGLKPDTEVLAKEIPGVWLQGIPPLAQIEKPVLNSINNEVETAENILLLAGYELDEPDTLLDVLTFEAIKKFQADKGLYPYGVLDFSTQKELNRTLSNLQVELDPVYARAVEWLQIK